jgi:hypothetical protein
MNSPGLQAFIYQDKNLLPDAAITAVISPSAKTPLVYPVTKQGTGNLRVQGSYEGAEDALIDLKIVDTAFTAPIVSSPIFKGAGTGKIKDIAASGIEAQKITLTCMSTGVSTQNATCEIEGVQFQAKAAGAAGNAITISIDNSELVFTLQTYSTLKDLKEGDTGLIGQEWDYDTKSILGEIIPDTAHRIAFGADRLHIYRQYKKFEDGIYKYYFVQPIKYAVPAGSKVYFVTEGRTVTVSDGVTDEVYEDIITIADLWAAVLALPSVLIEPVNGSIDTSMTPDSPAVRELAVMTDAYALPSYAGDNSSQYAGKLDSVQVGDQTLTQLISAECIDNTFLGQELWELKGSSSGSLGLAKSGELNQLGVAAFTIPQVFPKDWGTVIREDWSFKPTYMTREEGVTPPPICFAMKLGIKSVPQEFKLIYTSKPESCACPAVTFNDAYLGFQEEGGEIGMAYTIPNLRYWLTSVKNSMAERFIFAEPYESESLATSFLATFKKYEAIFAELGDRLNNLTEDDAGDLEDMLADFKKLVNSIFVLFSGAGVGGQWAASSPLTGVGFVTPTTPNGYIYQVVGTSGTTGETEPTWPEVLGDTVTDGTFTWRCYATTPAWDDEIAVTAGRYYQPVTPNGFWYLCLNDGTTGTTEPTWPELANAYVISGTARFLCVNPMVSVAMYVRWDGESWVYSFETVYLSGMTNLTSDCDLIYDTVLYRKIVDACLLYETTYGLKKNTVNLTGDVPYTQGEGDFYWKFEGGLKQYLPAYTDIPYYSIVNECGCGNVYINTKEFGLNISVPCGGTLMEGDTITVTIGGNTERTYQIGDTTYLPTVAAADIEMAGGIDGDDTYTFGVKGTVNTSFPSHLLDRDAPLPYKGTNAPVWQAGHSYSLTNYVKAVTFNGYRYECTTAGTSGGSAPTWPTTIGATVNDNGVVWTCRAVELAFEITDGIVMFAVGDSFEFNIEGGHFKWRKDAGTWSSAIAITIAFQEITEGVEVAFDFGVSPSFVVDDAWEIICLQENQAANMLVPWANSATKASGNIVFTFAAPVTVDSLIIDMHSLTGDVVFEASNESDFTPLVYTETISTAELISLIFEDGITARYFRIKPTGEQTIGYIFLGTMMRLDTDADKATPVMRFKMSTQESPEPFSLLSNKKIGFNLNYSKSWASNDDFGKIMDMIEYLKGNNNMPFYFVPNTDYPADAVRSWIDKDNFDDIDMDFDFNVPKADRTFLFTLPLTGVKKATMV